MLIKSAVAIAKRQGAVYFWLVPRKRKSAVLIENGASGKSLKSITETSPFFSGKAGISPLLTRKLS